VRGGTDIPVRVKSLRAGGIWDMCAGGVYRDSWQLAVVGWQWTKFQWFELLITNYYQLPTAN